MPAPSWEDTSAFVNPDDFGVVVTFTRAGDVIAQDVPGIFDDPVLNAESGEYDAAVSQPRFTCEWLRVAMLKKDDECTIDGVDYLLDHDPHADGTGFATLLMSVDFG